MNADLFMNGKRLTTFDTLGTAIQSSDEPFDFDRVFSVKADFSDEVLSKLAEKKVYEIEFDGGARGTTEGVGEDGIIVRMLNSEFQKIRRGVAE